MVGLIIIFSDDPLAYSFTIHINYTLGVFFMTCSYILEAEYDNHYGIGNS